MMFTPSRKKINLGGKKNEDRGSFLQRTEQERLRRQREKENQRLEELRAKSTLKIQAFIRAQLALRERRNYERKDWDEKIQKLQLLPPQLASAVPIFFPLFRQFLFFVRPAHDGQRLVLMCNIVLTSIRNKDAANFFSPYFKPETSRAWVVQVRKLARVCVSNLTTGPVDESGCTLTIRVLSAITTPNAVPFGSADDKIQLCARVIEGMLRERPFTHLANALRQVSSDVSPGREQLAGTLLGLALLPFQNQSVQLPANLAEQFTLQIFSIPRLLRKSPSVPIVALLPKVLRLPSVDELARGDGPELSRSLLDNLLCAAPLALQLQDPDVSTACLESIMRLVSVFFRGIEVKQSARRIREEYESEDEDEEEDEEEETAEERARAAAQAEAETVLYRLQGVLQQDALLSLFRLFVPRDTSRQALINISAANSGQRFGGLLPEGLVNLCRLCNLVHRSNNPARTAVLNTLSFSTDLVASLWKLLAFTFEFQEFVDKGSTRYIDQISAVLSLFATCYNHLLLTLDDEEFFQKQNVFSIDEVVAMSLALKQIAFRMYWEKEDRDAVYQNKELRDAITSVLHQLYDRNSRHIFCPDHIWTVEAVNKRPDQFQADVESRSKRAMRILKSIPFVVSSSLRVLIFQQLIDEDKAMVQEHREWGGETRITIRREFVFEDGFSHLSALAPEKLKGVVKVSFINSEGLPEAGIDGGGVFKEFLTELTKRAFGSDYGLFLDTADHLLYPNPHSHLISENHLRQFEFLGRVLGKALYEGIQVEVPFANFFLAKLLNKFNYYNDLIFLDPELHRNLLILKNYQGNVEEDFALNFTVTDNEYGNLRVKELIPGGKDVPVTADNRIKYIYHIANYRLNTQIRRQCQAFLRGFSEVIKPEWLRMFNQHELHLLIAGREGGIDLVDLRQNTRYGGGYHDEHPVIQTFWHVVETLSTEDQRKLLKFVTSCSRPPVLGFGYLSPPFSIHKAGGDRDRLPTASTCMNLLKLAPYKTADAMRQKLIYAIQADAGFELS